MKKLPATALDVETRERVASLISTVDSVQKQQVLNGLGTTWTGVCARAPLLT
jgi:hypothetical protein